MSPLLQTLLKQAKQLSYEEQLELIQGVAEMMKPHPEQTNRKRKLSEFRGIVQHPFFGEDAQAWVTKTRQEASEHREQRLRSES